MIYKCSAATGWNPWQQVANLDLEYVCSCLFKNPIPHPTSKNFDCGDGQDGDVGIVPLVDFANCAQDLLLSGTFMQMFYLQFNHKKHEPSKSSQCVKRSNFFCCFLAMMQWGKVRNNMEYWWIIIVNVCFPKINGQMGKQKPWQAAMTHLKAFPPEMLLGPHGCMPQQRHFHWVGDAETVEGGTCPNPVM